MQEYISKQQQIFRSAAQIFPLISNFSLLTPAVADKVEEWQADEERCSFKFKSFTVGLRFDEKVENKQTDTLTAFCREGQLQKGGPNEDHRQKTQRQQALRIVASVAPVSSAMLDHTDSSDARSILSIL